MMSLAGGDQCLYIVPRFGNVVYSARGLGGVEKFTRSNKNIYLKIKNNACCLCTWSRCLTCIEFAWGVYRAVLCSCVDSKVIEAVYLWHYLCGSLTRESVGHFHRHTSNTAAVWA